MNINQTRINYVDICFGLCWGDEGKGKIVSFLSKKGQYNFVCRWAGGNNAGHTIYLNGKKYKTHLIPSGVFFGIPSIIGPDCVINQKGFQEEINYLNENGFDTQLIKVSPKAHVITDSHIEEDNKKYFKTQGTTGKGIAPCYRDKYGRNGTRAESIDYFKKYLWDEKIYGNVLCEGAQGFWLDINYGNYPYVTSSTTLPYGACSLGFSPKIIRHIYGAAKIYDTRSGKDPLFPESLMESISLTNVGLKGEEYGTTTGRKRTINWLNLDKLINAIKLSGTTDIIISKVDILEELKEFHLIYNQKQNTYQSMSEMQIFIQTTINSLCPLVNKIYFSSNKEIVENFEF